MLSGSTRESWTAHPQTFLTVGVGYHEGYLSSIIAPGMAHSPHRVLSKEQSMLRKHASEIDQTDLAQGMTKEKGQEKDKKEIAEELSWDSIGR